MVLKAMATVSFDSSWTFSPLGWIVFDVSVDMLDFVNDFVGSTIVSTEKKKITIHQFS